MSTRSQSGIELSGYDFVPLREGGQFTLYRGWQDGNSSAILVVAPAAERPSPQSLRRLEHECLLAAKLVAKRGSMKYVQSQFFRIF